MFPKRALALVVPVVLGLSACPRPRVDFGRGGEPQSAEDVLKRVAQAEGSVLQLKGDGKLFVDAPQGKGAVSLFVVAAHPALLYLEQLDFFGRPQGVLTTDGTRFGLYDAQAGKYFQGPATPANLGRFLPVLLPPAELVGLLLGRAPRLEAESTAMTFDDTLGVFVITLRRGAIVQTLHVQPPTYRVVKSTVVGLRAYDVEFGDLSTIGTERFPRRVKLDAPTAHTKVELNWKDITLNEAPDLSLFEFVPPEGVPVVDVDGSGAPIR